MSNNEDRFRQGVYYIVLGIVIPVIANIVTYVIAIITGAAWGASGLAGLFMVYSWLAILWAFIALVSLLLFIYGLMLVIKYH